MERTFVMVKPDGVQRGLINAVIGKIENKGFRLVAMKMMQISEALAKQHYAEHKDKSFFPELVEFITSAPVVAMVWEGSGVTGSVRQIMGSTNPLDAAPGTIRGDHSVFISKNVVHGSDSPESAKREIALFFQDHEILSYERSFDQWIF
ncbi:MAG: nucleoside-diphosphate kinase [Acidobacteriota bacterium]